MSQQRSPGVDARGRRRPRVGPFRPLPTSAVRHHPAAGPAIDRSPRATRERPDEVPPGREIPTLLDDFHHVTGNYCSSAEASPTTFAKIR